MPLSIQPCYYFLTSLTFLLKHSVYEVSTKIITLNDKVVRAVRMFKDRFTSTPIIQKL